MAAEIDLIDEALRKLSEAQMALHAFVAQRKGELKTKPIDTAFLEFPLNELDLGKGYTARVQHFFASYRRYLGDGRYADMPMVTVSDLVALSEPELMRAANIGHETVRRLKALLAEHGLKLRSHYE
jgi:hypothetical protein